MTLFLTSSLLLAALLLFIPITMLAVECAAALLPLRSPQLDPDAPVPKVAVLIPAHNEALGITATLATLQPQMRKGDQLIVIADNCSDDTAKLSRQAGAKVLERHNLKQRGKGYALDYGRRAIQDPSPDVVVVIDADCRVAPNTIAQASHLAYNSQRPVQVTNLLYPPSRPTLKDQLSSFAFMVHTFVRPNGLSRLGLPFNLHGTGMVFPWSVFRRVPLASGNIVEDMQLSLDLAILGHFPLFCRAGQVTGLLPEQSTVAVGQRTRWEHGHLRTLLSQSPKLLKAAWRQKQAKLVALTLDLCVPPLSLLVLLWLLPTGLALPWGFFQGQWWPALILGGEGLLLLLSVLAIWAKFGREQLPLKTLLAVPFYVLWKVPIYFSFLLRPQRAWVRTGRE